MIKLNQLSEHSHELTIGNRRILFSYEQPVGIIFSGARKPAVTEKRWSNMTSRHINWWLDIQGAKGEADHTTMKQETIDRLAEFGEDLL